MFHIGPHAITNRVMVAPMAGVTDRPFRKLCKRFGAGYAVSEMVTSRPDLRDSLKTSHRLDHVGEPGLIAVQIAGTDAAMMADAARYNIDKGAQVIDINMGCPAKKVCNRWAGSALMQTPELALAIMGEVVRAALPHGIPVTLKMRTGWRADQLNALPLALAAEQAGVQMITIHGRTREMGYGGVAQHETVAQIKSCVRVPVVANGDIDSPQKAAQVLQETGVDAIMIGRAAMGRPWLFREIDHYLQTGAQPLPPRVSEVKQAMLEHMIEHYELHGHHAGVRSVRKHMGWYVRDLPGAQAFRSRFNALVEVQQQLQAASDFWDALANRNERLTYVPFGEPLESINE